MKYSRRNLVIQTLVLVVGIAPDTSSRLTLLQVAVLAVATGGLGLGSGLAVWRARAGTSRLDVGLRLGEFGL
jgi:hypothetical protein